MTRLAARRTKTVIIRWLGIAIAVCAIGWGVDYYASNNWVQGTYPADDASDVPGDAMIVVNWKGTRSNNLGLTIRYSDAPDASIPGTTAATKHGITFKPEEDFDSGREVTVNAEAGRRHHAFSFTIADDDEGGRG